MNGLLLRISAAALVSGGSCAVAAHSFDCTALSLSGTTVQSGYSVECARDRDVPAPDYDVRVPSDMGFAPDILGNGTRTIEQLYSFQIIAFQILALRSSISNTLFGIDYSPDGTQLCGVTAEFESILPRGLGTIPQPNGNFTPIAALTGLVANDTINGFALYPLSGVAYLPGSSGAPMSARLYLATAVAPLVGTMAAPTDSSGTILRRRTVCPQSSRMTPCI